MAVASAGPYADDSVGLIFLITVRMYYKETDRGTDSHLQWNDDKQLICKFCVT